MKIVLRTLKSDLLALLSFQEDTKEYLNHRDT